MIIVADASPLIFLGKLRQLDLIRNLFKGEVLIPESVREEVLNPPLMPAEEVVLTSFLETCKIVKVSRPRLFASALSRADRDALTLAARKQADILLADDRLVREMAEIEGIRPMGTLGILLKSAERGTLKWSALRRMVDELIRDHHFRISIEVYEAVLERCKE